MPTADELSDAELTAKVAAVLAQLARETVRVEIRLGAAHDSYPPPLDKPPALVVLDDPIRIATLFAGLATADVARRVVAQVLPGLRMEFCDDEITVGVVHLLSPSWVRGPWPYDGLLAHPILVDVLDRLGPEVWPDRTIEEHLLGAAPPGSSQARALVALWDARWPGVEPVAENLPSRSERWVRFHSLPGSKRYAEDESEYEELLRRHRVVLDELARYDGADCEIIVVTRSWSGSPVPIPREAPVTAELPDSQYWMSLLSSDPDDEEVWTHLFFDVVDRDDPRIERLLRLVADDVADGVLIGDPNMRWLFHPYDGGADVYPATVEHRDELRDRHRDWLSPHHSGY